ncbi:LytTR family DNA-binding domain-containing protein [Halobacillus kuroshimensis]|uniref:LytTR family DNA-binding domain-containing protein n=1 Tax=Halobacillus kuroshimensis TaxID=302481 RepID=UPI00040CB07D|nr:LytTR family DNA-binding domain-containing protein [Halobacillus kuroshimensis]
MKLGLICGNDHRERILGKFEALGIEIYRQADVYVVQEGLQDGFLPCIVFHPDHLEDLTLLLQTVSSKASSTKIVGMKQEEFHVLPHADILYFEAQDAVVFCHTKNDVYRMKEKLFRLEERLPGEQFIKVSRSFIVHINTVEKIIPWFNRRLLLTFEGSKKEVEVSKNYVKSFKAFLGMR